MPALSVYTIRQIFAGTWQSTYSKDYSFSLARKKAMLLSRTVLTNAKI